jgi:Tfp pilus assembly protein PilN
MIEINLLPGTGKKKAGRGGGGGAKSVNFAAIFAGLSEKIKDPWLIAAVVSVVLAAVGVGGLYLYQEGRTSSLVAQEEKALQDSTTFSAVMRDKVKAEAKRDTLLRQLNIIRSIDDDRFSWSHVMDEVSKALPPYTWLTVMNFTGTPQGSVNVAATAKPAEAAPAAPPPDGAAPPKVPKKARKLDTEVPKDEVKIRMLGLTADIQALTRFMKQLEASPFFTNVQLNKSELSMDQGKEVTQFTLDVTYARPETGLIQRVPLAASVK